MVAVLAGVAVAVVTPISLCAATMVVIEPPDAIFVTPSPQPSVMSAPPSSAAPPTAPASQRPARTPAPPAEPAPEPYYASCKEAKLAGAAPLIRGVSPGYRPGLDGDGDGKACE
jgi:hypothetical protein